MFTSPSSGNTSVYFRRGTPRTNAFGSRVRQVYEQPWLGELLASASRGKVGRRCQRRIAIVAVSLLPLGMETWIATSSPAGALCGVRMLI
jgi:hypothetical protein